MEGSSQQSSGKVKKRGRGGELRSCALHAFESGDLSCVRGQVIGSGWDTVSEAFDLQWRDSVERVLKEAKEEAQAADDSGDGEVMFELHGERFFMSARGARGGVVYWFRSLDGFFQVLLRSRKMKWNISVRYSSIGLWQSGFSSLHDRVHDWLGRAFKVDSRLPIDHWQRLVEAHFAIDLHSPDFSEEMRPELLHQFICHQETKQRLDGDFEVVSRGGYLETITIGKKNSLQIQVYDKGKEITEVSGKDWMRDVWAKGGWVPDELRAPTDVWRVEVRFGKEFLRHREILTFSDFHMNLLSLMSEALQARRLTERVEGDSNKSRWPTHWFWNLVLVEIGEIREWCGTGRRFTVNGDYLVDQLLKNAVGCLRAASVIRDGEFLAGSFVLFRDNLSRVLDQDKNHDYKVNKLQIRYEGVMSASFH